jgi:hypothetical protein
MDMTQLKEKANGLFAKLPFRAWAENIPAAARAKFPLLEKAIPFANQIAGALVLVIAVTLIACGGGKGGGGGNPEKAARDFEAFDKAMSEGDIEKAAAIAKKSERKDVAQATNFSYDLTEDGKGIVITKYDGPGGVVVIPSVIEDYPVVKVTARFGPHSNVTEVVFPNTVTELGERMFAGSSSANETLTKVTLPAGLKVIPSETFHGCNNLTEVKMPAGLERIEYRAFAVCTSLVSLELPESLKYIGYQAFAHCVNLFNLNIPGSLTSIEWGKNGGRSFDDCGKLPIKTRQRLKELGYEGGF